MAIATAAFCLTRGLFSRNSRIKAFETGPGFKLSEVLFSFGKLPNKHPTNVAALALITFHGLLK